MELEDPAVFEYAVPFELFERQATEGVTCTYGIRYVFPLMVGEAYCILHTCMFWIDLASSSSCSVGLLSQRREGLA